MKFLSDFWKSIPENWKYFIAGATIVCVVWVVVYIEGCNKTLSTPLKIVTDTTQSYKDKCKIKELSVSLDTTEAQRRIIEKKYQNAIKQPTNHYTNTKFTKNYDSLEYAHRDSCDKLYNNEVLLGLSREEVNKDTLVKNKIDSMYKIAARIIFSLGIDNVVLVKTENTQASTIKKLKWWNKAEWIIIGIETSIGVGMYISK